MFIIGGVAIGAATAAAWFINSAVPDSNVNQAAAFMRSTVAPRLVPDTQGQTWYQRKSGRMEQWMADAQKFQNLLVEGVRDFTSQTDEGTTANDLVSVSMLYLIVNEYLNMTQSGN